MIIPTEAREELMALAFGMSTKRYVDKIWSMRRVGQGAVKARSLSWPPTCRTAEGYVLQTDASNVTPIKKARANG